MSEFVKPRKVFVNETDFINKLLSTPLEKDLEEDEELCPICHGTGITISDNKYGIENDPDKKIGTFPYKHQSFCSCGYCYNGVVHKCKFCGKILSRSSSFCNCDGFKDNFTKQMIKEEQKKLNEAEEFEPDALGTKFDMCYIESYNCNDGYFDSWEDFFDCWYSEHEDEPDEKQFRPKYAWGTERVDFKINAHNIVQSELDNLDFDDLEIDNNKMEELQNLLNKWCETCYFGDYYTQSDKYKVKIPWDKYDNE